MLKWLELSGQSPARSSSAIAMPPERRRMLRLVLCNEIGIGVAPVHKTGRPPACWPAALGRGSQPARQWERAVLQRWRCEDSEPGHDRKDRGGCEGSRGPNGFGVSYGTGSALVYCTFHTTGECWLVGLRRARRTRPQPERDAASRLM